MTGQQPIRASDRDREHTADMLRDAYAAGCLDGGELEQRSGLAYAARTLDDLQSLTADLPAWLLERPVPGQYGFRPSPQRSAPLLPWGLAAALAGLCIVAVSVAWAPLAVIPLVVLCLLVLARGSRWPPRPPRRQ